MMEFIRANLADIILIAIVVAGLAGLYFAGKKTAVRKIVYNIIKQADLKYDATPDERFQTIYDMLPKMIRLLYSLKDLRKIADDLLGDIEKALEDKNNGAQG